MTCQRDECHCSRNSWPPCLYDAAGNLKFSPEFLPVGEPIPGWFVLLTFGGSRRILAASQDWNDILTAYRARPPYVYTAPTPAAPSGLASKIQFTI